MKDIKLDTLFRKKLANYTRQPSAGAWDAINGQLSATRKRNGYYRYSAAAAIAAVVAIAGYLAFHVSTQERMAPNERQTVVAVEPLHPERVQEPVKNQEVAPQAIAVEPQDLANQDHAEVRIVEELIKEPDVKQLAETIQVATLELKEPLPLPEAIEQAETAQIVANAEFEKEGAPDMPALPPVTITYSRSVYIAETDDPAAQSSVDKEKGVDRLIALAGNIRNSGVGLANLREAKDNLLDIDLGKLEDIWVNQTN